MAARHAAGPSSSQTDIDLYSDLAQNDEDLDRIAEANELFDAVLTGSVDRDKKVTPNVMPPNKTLPNDGPTSVKIPGKYALRRLSLYIGNFPWWTSDKDIMCMAQTLGVKDIKEIKFAENKLNGQSRGFAEVVVTSEESLKILLEKIPHCELNGDKVDCRFATRHNLGLFEDIANKLHDGHNSQAYSQQKHTPRNTDRDFEELMNRNKAVASSAISKAVSGATAGDLRVAMETLLTAIAIIKQSRVYGDERCQALVTSLKDCLVSIQGNQGYREKTELSARFSAGVAVVLGKTKETGTGVATESATENGTEKIPLVGKLQECLEDTDNARGAGRGKRNAPENGRGREITETGTANLTDV
ncbi:Cleavage and polyadenylation specificity factor subunit 7 [Liparis tanakae]|uniref:Cleavage and polyadenylation specificity factor subunit 7 n=1 Tax=Liparis tanakae TaxID=230148 RepID=A0A4Z2J8X1_9TELE|nr:Cleavage and polyadenylation specificity factor subunit 7 [Liparis tanakae]